MIAGRGTASASARANRLHKEPARWRWRYVVLGLLAACAAQPRPTVVGHSADSLLAPITGSDALLAQAAGKVLLLDVWASWCETCAQTLPLDVELQRELGNQGLVVVTLNVDADSRAAEAFLKALDLQDKLTVLRDPEARHVEDTFAVVRLPATYVIDRRGIVRHVESGYSRSGRENLERMLADLIHEAHP